MGGGDYLEKNQLVPSTVCQSPPQPTRQLLGTAQPLLTAPQGAGTHMQLLGFAKIIKNYPKNTQTDAESGLWETFWESGLTALPGPTSLSGAPSSGSEA